ncbi:unnamed protein product [Cochlearia groenlandica]
MGRATLANCYLTGAEEDEVYGVAGVDQDSGYLKVGYVELYDQGVIVRFSEAECFSFLEGDGRAFEDFVFRIRFPDLSRVLLDRVHKGVENLGTSHDHIDPFLRGFFVSVVDLGFFSRFVVSFDGRVLVSFGMSNNFEIEVREVTGLPPLDEDSIQAMTILGVMAFHSVELAIRFLVSDPLVARERAASSSSGFLAYNKGL